MTPDVLQRLTQRLNGYPDRSACWQWTGRSVGNGGYGAMWANGKARMIHRLTYEHFRGAIPDGVECDHLCRLRTCANPWHIDLVPHVVNVRRGLAVGPRPVCAAGHAKTPDNLRIVRRGDRQEFRCRTCQRANNLRCKARRREHPAQPARCECGGGGPPIGGRVVPHAINCPARPTAGPCVACYGSHDGADCPDQYHAPGEKEGRDGR